MRPRPLNKIFAEIRVQLDRTPRVTSGNDVFNVLQQYFSGRIHQKEVEKGRKTL
jgi:hypothetical protein